MSSKMLTTNDKHDADQEKMIVKFSTTNDRQLLMQWKPKGETHYTAPEYICKDFIFESDKTKVSELIATLSERIAKNETKIDHLVETIDTLVKECEKKDNLIKDFMDTFRTL